MDDLGGVTKRDAYHAVLLPAAPSRPDSTRSSLGSRFRGGPGASDKPSPALAVRVGVGLEASTARLGGHSSASTPSRSGRAGKTALDMCACDETGARHAAKQETRR